MSRIPSCLPVGAWLLLANLHAFAQVSVQLAGLEGRSQPNPVIPALFGGSQQKLDLRVGETITLAGTSLRADLYQVAGTLARPIAANLQLEEVFPVAPSSGWTMQVSLKFPEVKGRTAIVVHLSGLLESIQPNGIRRPTPVVLGDLRFEVYPATVTKDLTDLLQPKPDGSAQIVVFGPGQKLRQFLTGLHVSFEYSGIGTPDRFDPNRLYFGELATDEQFQQVQDRSAGARLVLFSPDESLPAGVYTDRSSSGVLIHVTAPLLDNLNDDPRAQLGLIKITRLLSAPPPSAN